MRPFGCDPITLGWSDNEPHTCPFCGEELVEDVKGGPYGSTLAFDTVFSCRNPQCNGEPPRCKDCNHKLELVNGVLICEFCWDEEEEAA